MIQDMDLKIVVRNSGEISWKTMEFSGEVLILGNSIAENRNPQAAAECCASAIAREKAKLPFLLITGPYQYGGIIVEMLKRLPEMTVYIAKDTFSAVRNYINVQVEQESAAGRRNEAKTLLSMPDRFIPCEYGNTVQAGNISLEFFQDGAAFGSASARISREGNSVLISCGNPVPELLSDLISPVRQEKSDILVLDVPEKDRFNVEDEAAISYNVLADEIRKARSSLGLFFVAADDKDIPLVIKSLNRLQDNGIVPQDIKICPVGEAARGYLRLYEDKDLKLNYASAYLRRGIQPAELYRDANCGFRIFVVPGADFSDVRQFSHKLFSMAKGNSAAVAVYLGLSLPESLKQFASLPEEGHCKTIACDLIGSPSCRTLEGFISKGGYKCVLVPDGNENIRKILPESYNLSKKSGDFSFFKDGEEKPYAVHSNENNAVVLVAGPDIKEKNDGGISSIISKIRELENREYGKIIILVRNEYMPIAQEIRQDALNSGIPAEIREIASPDVETAERNLVFAAIDISERYQDMTFFFGGDVLFASQLFVFAQLFKKTMFHICNGKISRISAIPFPYEERKLDAYWGNIRLIAGTDGQKHGDSVPQDLLAISLRKTENVYDYTANGLILDYYCRKKGKQCPPCAIRLTDQKESSKKNPSALVFIAGNSLLYNFVSESREDKSNFGNISADDLYSFVKNDSENAYRKCCHELAMLFAIQEQNPSLLNKCGKIFFIVQDTTEGKVVSAALEKFFANIGMESETFFVEPCNSDDVLNDVGIRNVASVIAGIKGKYGHLLFLLCGGDPSLSPFVYSAGMMFDDYVYSSDGDVIAEQLPNMPLPLDISSYSSNRKFMRIIEDLDLSDRYERLPELMRNNVLCKTQNGFAFTALMPILEAIHTGRNTSEQTANTAARHDVLMAGGTKNRPSRPFFIVRKADEGTK